MSRTTPLVLLALGGCASQDFGADVDSANDTISSPGLLEFTVVPSDQRAADDSIRVFPQVFEPILSSSIGGNRDFELTSPIRISGEILGEQVTPYAANGALPTQVVPVTGRVELADSEGVVQFTTEIDASDGAFSLDTLPGEWEIRVVPDAALLAPSFLPRQEIDANLRTNFALVPEQALYGQILVAGVPRPGAEVFAVDLDGRLSGVAATDAQGRYQLRVPPGRWEVTTTGIPDDEDPTLRAEPTDVTETLGAAVDLEYPSLGRVLVAIPVTSQSGASVEGLAVRFTARSLEGYGAVTSETEALVQQGGEALVLLIPGVYDVEIAPTDNLLAGWRAEQVEIDAPGQLTEVVLQPLSPLSGVVRDSAGTGVSGSRITCDELGFAGRTWTAFANEAGLWSLAVAPEVHCDAGPPADRSELANTLTTLTLTETDRWNPQLVVGRPLTGQVVFEDEPEPFAVVQVRDEAGWVVAQGLTDTDGNYALTLPPG